MECELTFTLDGETKVNVSGNINTDEDILELLNIFSELVKPPRGPIPNALKEGELWSNVS